MKNLRTYQHGSILEMSTNRKLFTNHGLHLNGLGKEVLSKQIVSLTYAILDQKKDLPIFLSWNSDLSHTDTLHQESVIVRTSARTTKTPFMKTDDFFMVNTGPNIGDVANIKKLNQKSEENYDNVKKSKKSIVYFKIFHQNTRGLGKKAAELLTHLHPDFPHFMCLTEHRLKYLRGLSRK